MNDTDAPWLWLIGGPNGAGKTTLAFSVLGSEIEAADFLNADEIARGLSPLHPQRMALPAGKLLLERIDKCVAARTSFAVETTLSSMRYIRVAEELRADGWRVGLLLVLLVDVEQALERVALRVLSGGHNIPEADVRRRFARCWRNIPAHARMCDRILAFDNGGQRSHMVAERDGDDRLTEYCPHPVLELLK